MQRFIPAVAFAGAAAIKSAKVTHSHQQCAFADSMPPPSAPPRKIEVDLLEKIANKKYLRTYSLNESDSDNDNINFNGSRPPGVPSKLRILTVDLPEFRMIWDDSCRVDFGRVFGDGVARDVQANVVVGDDKKTSDGETSSNTKTKKITVPQKSLVMALLRCGSDVEIIECSMGKMVDPNQRSYKEELQMRLSGRADGFASPLKRSGWWGRWFTGSDYRWSSANEESKPLAVVANGETLDMVPGSLLLLSSVCKSNNVLLFVVNDPRVYKSDTKRDLMQVVGDLRFAIKNKIIRKAIKIKEGDAYERGKEAGRKIEKAVGKADAAFEERRWRRLCSSGGSELLRELRRRGINERTLRELAGVILVHQQAHGTGGNDVAAEQRQESPVSNPQE